MAVQQRPQHARIFGGAYSLFQVHILNQREVACAFFDGGVNGDAYSLFVGTIGHDDELPLHVFRFSGAMSTSEMRRSTTVPLVVDRHEARQLH
jgi:hypothetical protein